MPAAKYLLQVAGQDKPRTRAGQPPEPRFLGPRPLTLRLTSSRPGRRTPRAWPWPSRRPPWTPSRAPASGAPSTRSLASFRPRLVSSRTTLMTWIFLSPAALRMTSNSSCSSAAASAAAAAAAADRRDRDGRGGGDAELLLERLQELVQLEDGHVLEDVEQVSRAHGCHCSFLLFLGLGRWRLGRRLLRRVAALRRRLRRPRPAASAIRRKIRRRRPRPRLRLRVGAARRRRRAVSM